MTVLIATETLDDVWVRALEACARAPAGRLVHLVMAVARPGIESSNVRDVLDKFLADVGSQSIDTVRETIFPSSLYPDPQIQWSPTLSKRKQQLLDDSATRLYEAYISMLPLLLTANGNHSGTYFSRMITWPGKESGGTNQLALRIEGLRRERRANRKTNNTLDIDVAADATCSDVALRGVQVYSPTDKRVRGFPCLTHIDLTLHNGCLNALAVYRHQHLIEKAYGNLVGLSALVQFLAQQGGFEVGELVMHATMADAQRAEFGARVAPLVRSSRQALDAGGPSRDEP